MSSAVARFPVSERRYLKSRCWCCSIRSSTTSGSLARSLRSSFSLLCSIEFSIQKTTASIKGNTHQAHQKTHGSEGTHPAFRLTQLRPHSNPLNKLGDVWHGSHRSTLFNVIPEIST